MDLLLDLLPGTLPFRIVGESGYAGDRRPLSEKEVQLLKLGQLPYNSMGLLLVSPL